MQLRNGHPSGCPFLVHFPFSTPMPLIKQVKHRSYALPIVSIYSRNNCLLIALQLNRFSVGGNHHALILL